MVSDQSKDRAALSAPRSWFQQLGGIFQVRARGADVTAAAPSGRSATSTLSGQIEAVVATVVVRDDAVNWWSIDRSTDGH